MEINHRQHEQKTNLRESSGVVPATRASASCLLSRGLPSAQQSTAMLSMSDIIIVSRSSLCTVKYCDVVHVTYYHCLAVFPLHRKVLRCCPCQIILLSRGLPSAQQVKAQLLRCCCPCRAKKFRESDGDISITRI